MLQKRETDIFIQGRERLETEIIVLLQSRVMAERKEEP
jgi:hypothetical protein